ncbi:hypothetical protein HOG98_08225 [bacterium]|jgi:hypothetical protein|nr:hypothetical protein [bacterium]
MSAPKKRSNFGPLFKLKKNVKTEKHPSLKLLSRAQSFSSAIVTEVIILKLDVFMVEGAGFEPT